MALTNTEALKEIIDGGDLEKLRWFALDCANRLDQIAAMPTKSPLGDPQLVTGLVTHNMSYGHCEKHDCPATNGCPACEAEDPRVAREKLLKARQLILETQTIVGADNALLAACSIDNLLWLLALSDPLIFDFMKAVASDRSARTSCEVLGCDDSVL